MPLLEVVTRHHPGRPGLLARCMASLNGQTDGDWMQTLLNDGVGMGVAWANHGLATHAPHLVGEYIWVLDDDDQCIRDTLVAEVREIVERYAPDVIMVKGQHVRHGVLPDDGFWGEAPAFGHVGMSCFILRREVFQRHAPALRVSRGADFAMLDAVWASQPAIYWHDRVVADFDRESFGAAERADVIGVVSCVWKRPERLAYTLGQLARQTDQGFHLYLINNNSALVDFVNEQVEVYAGPVTVIHNESNRGPYARIEVMHAQCGLHPWFLTLDDDVDFWVDWVESWRDVRKDGTVQGWTGWRFVDSYWQREPARSGEACHYLWGSNLAVPAAAVTDGAVLALDERYWQCDDLWLCYFANHVAGLPLEAVTVAVEVVVDGKDAYHSQVEVKVECLEMLRGRGWLV